MGKHELKGPFTDEGEDVWTPDPRSVVRHGIVDPFYEGAHRHLTGVFDAVTLPGGRSIWMPTNQIAKQGREALEGCTDPTCSRCYGVTPLDFVLKRL